VGYPRIGVNRVINKIVQHTLEAYVVQVGCTPAFSTEISTTFEEVTAESALSLPR